MKKVRSQESGVRSQEASEAWEALGDGGEVTINY